MAPKHATSGPRRKVDATDGGAAERPPAEHLDIAGAVAFRQQVKRLIESGANELIIDLGLVTAVRGTGHHAVIGGLESAAPAGDRGAPAPGPDRQLLLVLDVDALDGFSCPATPPLAASEGHLDAIHDTLAQFWKALGVPPDERWRLLFELAVAENAANIIEHARAPALLLRLHEETDTLIAEFTDTGKGMDRPVDLPPDGDAFAERGRGLMLAHAALDEITYERVGATNRWRLAKRR
jgi:serine/threonine-protein kinase RsbW